MARAHLGNGFKVQFALRASTDEDWWHLLGFSNHLTSTEVRGLNPVSPCSPPHACVAFWRVRRFPPSLPKHSNGRLSVIGPATSPVPPRDLGLSGGEKTSVSKCNSTFSFSAQRIVGFTEETRNRGIMRNSRFLFERHPEASFAVSSLDSTAFRLNVNTSERTKASFNGSLHHRLPHLVTRAAWMTSSHFPRPLFTSV